MVSPYIKIALIFVSVSVFGRDAVQPSQASAQGWSEFSFILKPDSLGGIGLFATHDLPAGILLGDRTRYRVRVCKRADIPQALIKYCDHVSAEETIRPDRFDHLPIKWYINHSITPNTTTKGEFYVEDGEWLVFNLYSVKEIKSGEEITMNYNELNEPEETKEDFYRSDKVEAPDKSAPPAKNK